MKDALAAVVGGTLAVILIVAINLALLAAAVWVVATVLKGTGVL